MLKSPSDFPLFQFFLYNLPNGILKSLLYFFLFLTFVIYIISLPIEKKILSRYNHFFSSERFFITSTILVLIIVRLKFIFFPYKVGYDENIWILLAEKLQRNSIPYKDFNGTTTGFLNIYALKVIDLVGLSYNYVSLRLFGLFCCIIPSLILFYYSVKKFYNQQVAHLAFFILIFYYSFVSLTPPFIAYDSEHIVMLLTSSLLFLSVQLLKNLKFSTVFFASIIIGILPYTKLQSAPFCIFFGFFFFLNLLKNKKLKWAIFFIALCFLPSLIIIYSFYRLNVLDDFYQSYIVTNFTYVKYTNANSATDFSFYNKLRFFFKVALKYNLFYYFFYLTCLSFLFVKWKEIKFISINLIFPIAFFLFAFSCFYLPNTFFEYYTVILTIPLAFLTAAILYHTKNKIFNVPIHLILIIFAIFISNQVIKVAYKQFKKNKEFITVNETWKQSGANNEFLTRDEIALKKYVDLHTEKNDLICFFGSGDALKLLIKCERGTPLRTVDSYLLNLPDTLTSNYHVKNCTEDLELHKPKIFIFFPSVNESKNLDAYFDLYGTKIVSKYVSEHYYIDSTISLNKNVIYLRK